MQARIIYFSSCKGGVRTYTKILQDHFKRKKKEWIIKTICGNNGHSLPLYLKHCYDINSLSFIKKLEETIKNCDFVHLNFPASSAEIFISKICKKYGVPYITTFHVPLGNGIFSLPVYYSKFIIELQKKSCKKFIFVSEYQKKKILGRKHLENSVVIEHGIDLKKYRKKKVKRFFDGFTLGFLGRLDLEKNIVNLIKACRDLKINLAIAGKGDLYKKIKKMENGHIKVLGFFKDEVYFYNAIDAYILPSYAEACVPFSVLEAMACETPIIVSPIVNIEGDFCIKMKGFGKEDIKKAILEMKDRFSEDLGKEARKVARKKYSMERMLKQTEEVYEEALKSRI